MIERTEATFGIKPEWLAGDTAYGSARITLRCRTLAAERSGEPLACYPGLAQPATQSLRARELPSLPLIPPTSTPFGTILDQSLI